MSSRYTWSPVQKEKKISFLPLCSVLVRLKILHLSETHFIKQIVKQPAEWCNDFYRKITKAACNFMFILVLIHPFVNYPLNPSISFYLWIKNSVMTNNIELKSICTKHNDESTGNESNQLSSYLSHTNSDPLHNTTTNTHDKENG